MIDFSDYTFLALGSNLGNRQENLMFAIKELREHMLIVKKSKIYESLPFSGLSQANYLNMVIMVKQNFSPYDLLLCVQEIERKIGRQKQAIWSSRLIDIDILFIGNSFIDTVDLVVPHKEHQKRDFVLRPLADIAPGFIPVNSDKTIKEMLAAVCDDYIIAGDFA